MDDANELLTKQEARIMIREIIREEVPPIVTKIVTEVVSEATTLILNVMAERFALVERRFDRLEAIVNRHSLCLDDHEVRIRSLEARTG